MTIDPRTVIASVGVLGLLFTGLATILWWTRRTYPGFGLWATAGVLAVLSLFLLSLGPNAPDSISRMGANATLVVATVLYASGARRFRGHPAGSGLLYAGGVLTVAAYAFFLYVVPSGNSRAALMSTFMGVVLLVAARTLFHRRLNAHSFGLWLTTGLFALCGATHLVRAVATWVGPPRTALFLPRGSRRAGLRNRCADVPLSNRVPAPRGRSRPVGLVRRERTFAARRCGGRAAPGRRSRASRKRTPVSAYGQRSPGDDLDV